MIYTAVKTTCCVEHWVHTQHLPNQNEEILQTDTDDSIQTIDVSAVKYYDMIYLLTVIG